MGSLHRHATMLPLTVLVTTPRHGGLFICGSRFIVAPASCNHPTKWGSFHLIAADVVGRQEKSTLRVTPIVHQSILPGDRLATFLRPEFPDRTSLRSSRSRTPASRRRDPAWSSSVRTGAATPRARGSQGRGVQAEAARTQAARRRQGASGSGQGGAGAHATCGRAAFRNRDD